MFLYHCISDGVAFWDLQSDGSFKMCADMVLPLCWFTLNKKYGAVTEVGRVVIWQDDVSAQWYHWLRLLLKNCWTEIMCVWHRLDLDKLQAPLKSSAERITTMILLICNVCVSTPHPSLFCTVMNSAVNCKKSLNTVDLPVRTSEAHSKCAQS